VDLEEAIRGSCNVYFYQLGYKLGIERIAHYAKMFGFGSVTGSDVRGEKPGLVPDPLWSLQTRDTPWYAGETISVSIGQGALTTTPLQLARMMAAVSNGGYLVKPHLLLGESPQREPLPLAERHIQTLLEALQAVVNDPTGTAYGHGRLSGLRIAGKTGTAQVVGRSAWRETMEETPIAQRDHAWFASFAPVEDPRLVVVVFVEHGGKGSEVAAPVARALYEIHFQADRPL
jgi:penicillin-binding protein 2